MGIEPTSSAWKAEVLPLNDYPIYFSKHTTRSMAIHPLYLKYQSRSRIYKNK